MLAQVSGQGATGRRRILQTVGSAWRVYSSSAGTDPPPATGRGSSGRGRGVCCNLFQYHVRLTDVLASSDLVFVCRGTSKGSLAERAALRAPGSASGQAATDDTSSQPLVDARTPADESQPSPAAASKGRGHPVRPAARDGPPSRPAPGGTRNQQPGNSPPPQRQQPPYQTSQPYQPPQRPQQQLQQLAPQQAKQPEAERPSRGRGAPLGAGLLGRIGLKPAPEPLGASVAALQCLDSERL